ncbi:MAG: CoA-binding protein [Chloroflexi bacterium]|nr:MAG: CoA-binding protein [Chloroflexota bacterium]
MNFLSLKTLAVVGVSRNKDKFGNAIFRKMKAKGYKILAVNPRLDLVEGDRCYAGLGALPEKPEGVILAVSPSQTISVIEEAARLGSTYVWMQQGANSPEGEARCKELGLNFVSGECIFMFAEPMESFHKIHRFFNRLFGKMPK